MPKKKYSFPEIGKLNDVFREVFGVGFKPFYDKMSPFLGCLCIDIVAFDEWLIKQVGDYEALGLNMTQAIIMHYGEKANDLVDSLLPE